MGGLLGQKASVHRARNPDGQHLQRRVGVKKAHKVGAGDHVACCSLAACSLALPTAPPTGPPQRTVRDWGARCPLLTAYLPSAFSAGRPSIRQGQVATPRARLREIPAAGTALTQARLDARTPCMHTTSSGVIDSSAAWPGEGVTEVKGGRGGAVASARFPGGSSCLPMLRRPQPGVPGQRRPGVVHQCQPTRWTRALG